MRDQLQERAHILRERRAEIENSFTFWRLLRPSNSRLKYQLEHGPDQRP